jgi:hypothetical protein
MLLLLLLWLLLMLLAGERNRLVGVRERGVW